MRCSKVVCYCLLSRAIVTQLASCQKQDTTQFLVWCFNYYISAVLFPPCLFLTYLWGNCRLKLCWICSPTWVICKNSKGGIQIVLRQHIGARHGPPRQSLCGNYWFSLLHYFITTACRSSAFSAVRVASLGIWCFFLHFQSHAHLLPVHLFWLYNLHIGWIGKRSVISRLVSLASVCLASHWDFPILHRFCMRTWRCFWIPVFLSPFLSLTWST